MVLCLSLPLLCHCSLKVVHSEKGVSPFNSHSPTKEMSDSFKKDLVNCREFTQKMLIKTGLRFYRDQHAAIKYCLRQKGWDFTF